ncbi:MAG: hypothetical protein GY778_30460, partial [bacterium]|nr:hypothetical protein [bacterium]
MKRKPTLTAGVSSTECTSPSVSPVYRKLLGLTLLGWAIVLPGPAWADDVDSDGVDDVLDVCNNTPPGIAVDAMGRPLGDVDLDCDVDLADYSLMQANFTGPFVCIPDCTGLECGDDGCGGSCGTCEPGESCISGLCFIACNDDPECDDGLFCNGAEICKDGGCHRPTAGVPNGTFDGGAAWSAAVDPPGTGGNVSFPGSLTVVGSDNGTGGFTYVSQGEVDLAGQLLEFDLISYTSFDQGNFDRPVFYIDGVFWGLDESGHLGSVASIAQGPFGNIDNSNPIDRAIHFTVPIEGPGGPGPHEIGFGVMSVDGAFGPGVAVFDNVLPAEAVIGPCPGLFCDEINDLCVGCTGDNDCDDSLFCNGPETCGTDGICHDGDDPCSVNQVCDEVNDRCTGCLNDLDCDDGTFCNGAETCGTDGFCRDGDDPCAANETCVEDGDTCVTIVCTSDGVCDDGNFCNGAETCGTDGFCDVGTDPCDPATETCNETSDTCDLICPPTIVTLTLGADAGAAFTGDCGDDTFNAPLIFNPPSGTNVPSLQNFDVLDGGAGNDRVNAEFNFGAGTTVQPTVAAIETFNVTDFGTASTTLSFANITGADTLNSTNGTNANALVLNNVPNPLDLGITQTNAGMTVNYTTGATTAADDSTALNLNNVGAGTVTIVSTGVNGLETVGIDSGGSANTLAGLTQTNGTSMATLNCTGDQDLTVTAALPPFTTINCAGTTGKTTLTTSATAANVAYTGGPADDMITLQAYTTLDTVNGGSGGNDTLALLSASAVVTSAQTNVSNIDVLRVTDQLNGALVLSYFGATDAYLAAAAANGATITLPTGTPHSVTINNSDNAGALGIIQSGMGTADVLNLNLANADMGGTLTCTSSETVNLASDNGSGGTAADGGANTATAITVTPTAGHASLVVTGSVPLTMSGAITAQTVNASAATGAFTMGTNIVSASNGTVSGGTGADVLYGSPSIGDSIV